MRKFAERLKELRLERGLSIAALGQRIGVGAASVCRWEKGGCDVKGDSLISLAKFFEVSADYLLGLED